MARHFKWTSHQLDKLNEEMERQESERVDIQQLKEMARRSYDRMERP